MVQIGIMRVGVAQGRMPVPVRMASYHAVRVGVVVVPVVMPMRVFMFQRLV